MQKDEEALLMGRLEVIIREQDPPGAPPQAKVPREQCGKYVLKALSARERTLFELRMSSRFKDPLHPTPEERYEWAKELIRACLVEAPLELGKNSDGDSSKIDELHWFVFDRLLFAARALNYVMEEEAKK